MKLLWSAAANISMHAEAYRTCSVKQNTCKRSEMVCPVPILDMNHLVWSCRPVSQICWSPKQRQSASERS